MSVFQQQAGQTAAPGGGAPPQTLPVMTSPAGSAIPPNVAKAYKARQSVGFGITLIVAGVLAMIFNGVQLGVEGMTSVVGYGFWVGATYIVAGVTGVLAKNKYRSRILAFMILSILSALVSIVLIGFGIGVAVNSSSGCDSDCTYSYCRYYCNRTDAAMGGLLAVLGFASGIISIWGSTLCCSAICFCQNQPTYGMMMAPMSSQQVVVFSQDQNLQPVVAYQAAPMMVSPVQTTGGLSGYTQLQHPVHQQQWVAQAQPGMAGPSRVDDNTYTSLLTSGLVASGGSAAPPPYAVGEPEKRPI